MTRLTDCKPSRGPTSLISTSGVDDIRNNWGEHGANLTIV
jgi:hypothetical protein